MPPGVYAVTESSADARPGVVFFLRPAQRRCRRFAATGPPARCIPSILPTSTTAATIRFGCSNARQSLAIFEAAAAGQTAPITELCDRFDQETKQGRDMAQYEKLLNDVIAHIRQAHANTLAHQLSIGGARDVVLPTACETPRDANDFELVTWLVIKELQ